MSEGEEQVSSTLDQNQIDTLIRALADGQIPMREDSLAHLTKVQTLDLSDATWSQDRIIRRRLPVLDHVFERLGPSLQITLTKSLRSPVRTENVSVELQKFGDFKRQFEGQTCLFEVMRLDPLRGYGLLILGPQVLYSIVDALMGGLGIGELPESREISDIEVSLLYKFYGDILRDYENAWKPWFPLRCEHIRSERSNQSLSTIDDEEVCHIGTLRVSGDVLPASPFNFVMPYTQLEPLLEATSARAGDEIDPNWRVNLERNMSDIYAGMSADLGQANISASTVRTLAEGDVIQLEKRIEEPIEVKVENQQVFHGRIGRSRNQYAVRITDRREIERQLVDRTAGQTLVRKGLITHEQLSVAQVDEKINRRPLLDSIVARGWVERRVLEAALGQSTPV